MKFRIARESEFETPDEPRLNPLRGTPLADQVKKEPEYEAAWLLEVSDLEGLRDLHNEIAQIETGRKHPPTMSVDFLPHFEGTPPDCQGIIFICE
jgi:hypothetical protein